MADRIDGSFTIAHLSDLHCGGQYFVPGLLDRAIAEINGLQPDIVVCSGDLTTFGFKHEYQFIDVPDYKGRGEAEPTPHWLVNLGEAEYAVALFMYMRLLDYPAHKISILTTYAGQRGLINDILNAKCRDHPFFGRPKMVATVDKYQGEQNDCKSPSLVSLCHEC